MINKIKAKLGIGDNKKITSNFLYLSIVQGANILLPLITFPYLVRTLGVEMFGLIMFAQAFILYFSLLADYGFNLSGTREISTHRNNHKKVVQIFSSIIIVKLGLIIVGFILMNIIVFSFEKFSSNWELYYITFPIVIGGTLYPVWFFQGMEKMKYITMLSLLAKIFFTISIFIFVHSPEDYLLVPLINSLGYITVALISFWIIYKDFEVTVVPQKIKALSLQFKRGWYIFLSNMSINLYTATNTFLLGIYTNDTTVGYYTIAEKVVRVISSLFTPFYQAIYPHVIQLLKKSREEAEQFLKKSFVVIAIISSVIWIIVFSLATPLFHLAFGNDVDIAIDLFKVLSPLIIILSLAFLLFNVTLLAYRMDKYFFKIYLIGGIINLILVTIFFLTIESKALGISLSILLTETIITFLAVRVLYQHNIIFNINLKKKDNSI